MDSNSINDDKVRKVFDLLESASGQGSRLTENGAKLFCPVPHIGPQAWLHLFFPPLKPLDMVSLEKLLQRPVPSAYKHFLGEFSNGLSIFSERLSLDGLRRDNSHTAEAMWQPFSLETCNLFERPRDASDEQFFIGGYGEDGSLLYMEDDKCFRCNRNSVKPLNHWPTFEDMLLGEVVRLSLLFDKAGKRLVGCQTTLP